jgi:ADP-heptose:LPS heptosyltransferase
LLGLALARALSEATSEEFHDVEYVGGRESLLRRCSLPLNVRTAQRHHIIHSGRENPIRFATVPKHPPIWLDQLSDGSVEVHSALPMRYYLAAEQDLGYRLPAERDPSPTFATSEKQQPFHVVFVMATSSPRAKDYGFGGFKAVAEHLAKRLPAPWRFSVVTGLNVAWAGALPEGMTVLQNLDLLECLDLFGSAEVVVGNDSGLTHLAALTAREDGSGPSVIGLYARHAHTKWITGSSRHHAVAARFSQMLAVSDGHLRRGRFDNRWRESWRSKTSDFPPETIAEFAGAQAGWW